MFCTSCGTPLQEGVSFCTNCGAPVKRSEPISVGETVEFQVAPATSFDAPPSPEPVPVEMAAFEAVSDNAALRSAAPVQPTPFEQSAQQVRFDQPAQPVQQPADYAQTDPYAGFAYEQPARYAQPVQQTQAIPERQEVVPYSEIQAAEGKKSNGGKLLAIVGVIAVLAIAAIVFGMNYLGGSSGSGGGQASAPAAPTVKPDPGATSNASAAAPSAPAASSESAPIAVAPDTPSAAFDSRCVDAYGTPTLYALMELTGDELVTLLESNGFTYDDFEEMWFADNGDNTMFGVLANDGNDEREDVAAMPKGARGWDAFLIIVSDDYATPEDMLAAQPIELDGQLPQESGVCMAVAHNSVGDRYLIAASSYYDAQMMLVFTEEATESGMFMDAISDGEDATGYSIDTLWSILSS